MGRQHVPLFVDSLDHRVLMPRHVPGPQLGIGPLPILGALSHELVEQSLQTCHAALVLDDIDGCLTKLFLDELIDLVGLRQLDSTGHGAIGQVPVINFQPLGGRWYAHDLLQVKHLGRYGKLCECLRVSNELALARR